ncbi:MAG TPA: glycosyltransferase family 39 protein [Thermoanaerobaculia bacterium]|jgi:hypothetical protein|nr:glycosyltransferase family 39 protein [Thermoanaerobaculia bacterium]
MNRRAALVASLFVALAVARIMATYPRFCQTFDEPVHVAMGLEWLDRGTYTLELQHPPLARVFDALLLRLDGQHYPPGPIVLTDPAAPVRKGNAIFGGPDDYQRNLTLARIGVLPWLLLAAFVVFHWTRSIANTESAVAAVALFTFVPAILGHAGLATTDMALAATLPAAIYALVRCLDQPSARRIAVFACALAAAVLSKFSAIPFLAVISAVVVVLKMRERGGSGGWGVGGGRARLRNDLPHPTPHTPLPLTNDHLPLPTPHSPLPTLERIAIAIPIAALLIWAAYRFSIWPTPIYGFPPNELLAMLAQAKAPPDRLLFFLLDHFRLPAPELFAGLAHLGEHSLFGHPSYFLGQIRPHGVWYFFPVVIALKTPIAFAILAVLGIRKASIPILSAAAIVVIAMASRINLGVRHVLPIYPLLAIAGGIALVEMWQRRRVIAIVLGAWLAVSSLLAHPDYIAYFNELAGRHPETIVVDSDLDWGQDLPSLRDAVAARGIDRLWIAYFGSTDLSRYPIAPAIRMLPPRTRVKGWIAISKTSLKGVYGQAGDYGWLDQQTPVQEIGRSMLLYHTE